MPRTVPTILLACLLAAPTHAADRKPPYWASIDAGKARMRAGPGKTYPATWLFRRADLPIRVVATYPNWRKVRTPDGTLGWMSVGMLSDARTAIVPAGPVKALRRSASDSAAVAYRIGPGVVGRLSDCGRGWCRMTVAGRSGYIRTRDVWGVDPAEELD